MIPEEELLSKPIKLRNECIFYLGHIPTFLDIHIARATEGKPSDPAYFWKIFERGVDPDVEDPTRCHAHSEPPEEWPPLETIVSFQQKVRGKVDALYASGEAAANHRVSRALWLGFEHDAMHLETLLYMLIQSDKILPPPGTKVPDFEAMATHSKALAVDNEWFTIPESDVKIGLDDPENDHESQRYFGWDNEKPHRSAHVKSFKAKGRPITNGEYATYLAQTGKTGMFAQRNSLTPFGWLCFGIWSSCQAYKLRGDIGRYHICCRDSCFRLTYNRVECHLLTLFLQLYPPRGASIHTSTARTRK
jgi:hypothetical protein